MTIWRKILATALLLALGTAAWGQTRGGTVADELNDLRQQQRQAQRDIGQYETSIRLLYASRGASDDAESTLEALQRQLKESEDLLKSLDTREVQLQLRLNPGYAQPLPTASTTPVNDPDAEDVARLKQLLHDYRSAELETAAQLATNSEGSAQTPAGGDANYSPDSVLLSGPEGLAAIISMNARLTDESTANPNRELDIIFHVEVRRDAKLVSSGSFSLKALGKSQYIGKVNVQGGAATINVRRKSWHAELTPAAASDYLVLLNILAGGQPELHFLSVADLKATQVSELPVWVPYIGKLAAAPAQP